MPYDFTFTWNLKNRVNEWAEQKQTHSYRDQTDGCQRGGELGDREKGDGIKKYKLTVTNNHRDVKYSAGNTVNNIIIPIYGVGRALDLLGWSLSHIMSNHCIAYLKLILGWPRSPFSFFHKMKVTFFIFTNNYWFGNFEYVGSLLLLGRGQGGCWISSNV